ncbi:hypothetical protein ACJBU6_08370 [Exserohilum turcicum]
MTYSVSIGSTTLPIQLALACMIRVQLIRGALARYHSPTITEKLGLSFRAGRETACAYSFIIPTSLPGADMVIFAWTWLNSSGNREFYMSCSPVRLIAARSPTKIPSGYHMFIANLQETPETPDSQHPVWSRCFVPQNVWVRYPQRYKGINPPIVADTLPNNSQIRHLELGDDGGLCGSDNKERVKALALQSS